MSLVYDCWCCATQRMVKVDGRIVGRRVAEVLRVSVCHVKDCHDRGCSGCLIDHEIEGRW